MSITAATRRSLYRAAPEVFNVLLIVLGIVSAGMGLHGFLRSSKFIDGGVTGVSMLSSKLSASPLLDLAADLQPAVHRPRLPADRPAFALRSARPSAGCRLVLATVHYPDVTPDKC